MYSLQVPLGFEYNNQSVINVWFSTIDDKQLEFDDLTPAIVVFDFIEGNHN